MENKIQNGFDILVLLIFPFALLNLILIPFAHYGVCVEQSMMYVVIFTFSFLLIVVISKIFRKHYPVKTEKENSSNSKFPPMLSIAYLFIMYLANSFLIVRSICKKVLSNMNGTVLQAPSAVILYDVVCFVIVFAAIFYYLKRRKQSLTSI